LGKGSKDIASKTEDLPELFLPIRTVNFENLNGTSHLLIPLNSSMLMLFRSINIILEYDPDLYRLLNDKQLVIK
jgi:hypothetical protein